MMVEDNRDLRKGHFFVGSFNQLKRQSLGVLDVPLYATPLLTSDVANRLSWQEFKQQMQPFFVYKDESTETEYIVTKKNPPWTFKDINIFVGNSARQIASLTDLTEDEGKLFFDINLKLAEEPMEEGELTHFSVGFNPLDNLPGRHSITTKLHSHIYVARNPEIMAQRVPVKVSNLNRFDSLSLVEPFSIIVRDFLNHKSAEIFGKELEDRIELGLGHCSIFLDYSQFRTQAFTLVRDMYTKFEEVYRELESIFTNFEVDPNTERYIPKSQDQRRACLSEYVEENNWLSKDSRRLLEYIAKYIRKAEPREGRLDNISSAGTAWFTKGFAGAFNFYINPTTNTIRVDYLPCAITASSMNKVLLGREYPTLVRRGVVKPTADQSEDMECYYSYISQRMRSILNLNNHDKSS